MAEGGVTPEERSLKLVEALNGIEEFREWRDKVAKPELQIIEDKLRHPLEMSEANLKALVLYQVFVKDLFYRVFENLAIQNQLEKE